ncbi:MAG: amidase [Myxococcales bacterium]|nr:amidase [Myxococcales bacterium]
MLGRGALEQAALLRSRELSPVELVEAHIERIEQVNPQLNAVVGLRFEAARREAREAEQRLAAAAGGAGGRVAEGAVPPLLGVPCTVKETFALEGFVHSGGSYNRREHRAARDAVTVQRTRAAGAIPLGTTNVPELAMWMETSNRIYGTTNNPYDLDRIVGGSSGGEAAIIAAGASPFGIGTDIGGSIRMPAFFCGVFGCKPTGGRVTLDSHYPGTFGDVERYCCAGPIARTARDLMPLLRIAAGDGSADDELALPPLGDPERVELRGRRVYVLDHVGQMTSGPTKRMRMALERAASALADHGAIVEPMPREVTRLSRRAPLIWLGMLGEAQRDRPDVLSFHQQMGQRADGSVVPPNLLLELLRLPFGRSRHTAPAILLALIEKAGSGASDFTARLFRLGQTLREALYALLDGEALVIAPTHPRNAPRHHVPLLFPFDFAYTALFNVMELPATAVPLGLDDRGVPLGVQVIAAHGREDASIAAALALEQSLGGWVAPPL